MVVEKVVIDRDNNVDITLAIPIGDDSPGSEAPEPDAAEPESVAIASQASSLLGSAWSFRLEPAPAFLKLRAPTLQQYLGLLQDGLRAFSCLYGESPKRVYEYKGEAFLLDDGADACAKASHDGREAFMGINNPAIVIPPLHQVLGRPGRRRR